MRRIDAAWTALLTAVILGPLLTGWGFWLFGDMVFVPEQPWKAAWLGLDGALPRAVPMDALVSVVTQVLPGELVQRALLVGAFLLGGSASACFVGDGTVRRRGRPRSRCCCGTPGSTSGCSSASGRSCSATSRCRGSCSPRAGSGATCAAAGPRRRWRWSSRAVCSPSSGVMARARRRGARLRRTARTRGRGSRPAWWPTSPGCCRRCSPTPSVSTQAGRVRRVRGARASRAPALLPSLLSLGGIWKTSIVPEARTVGAVVLLRAC